MPSFPVLRVSTPDGQVREFPIDFDQGIVGRADGNRIVIPHTSVARRHAHLFFENGELKVEDFGSPTGTFLNGRKLGAGERLTVSQGATLRFGDAEARLNTSGASPQASRSDPVASPPVAPGYVSGSVPVAPSYSSPAPSQGGSATGLALTFNSPTIPIAPGTTGAATVGIQNRGTLVEEISLTFDGVPPDWIEVPQRMLSLLPAARETVTVLFRVPAEAQVPAGVRRVTVTATSRSSGGTAQASGEINVAAVERIEATLHPVRSKGDFSVRIENFGNVASRVTVTGTDDEAVLRFEMDDVMEIPPHDSRTIRVKVRGKRRLFGSESATSFRILVKPAANPQAQRLDGALLQKPKLEAWKMPVAGLLVLAGLSGGAYGIASACRRDTGVCTDVKDRISGKDNSTPGPSAADAIFQGQTATAGTAEAKAAASASAAVAAALTPSPATGSPSAAASASTTGGAQTAATATKPPTGSPTPIRTYDKPDAVIDQSKTYTATIMTDKGNIVMHLLTKEAPTTTNTFVFLAQRRFYDGLTVFDVDNSLVKAGSPTNDGRGGPGFSTLEDKNNLKNVRGMVSMLKTGVETKFGSMFFINLRDNPLLDESTSTSSRYYPWAQVISGLDVAESLKKGDVIRAITISETAATKTVPSLSR